MANNRAQLYCKICLEVLHLGKYYPTDLDGGSGWGLRIDETNFDEFDAKHCKCFCENIDKIDHLGGEGMYGFRTENDEAIDGFCTAFNPHRLIKRNDDSNS